MRVRAIKPGFYGCLRLPDTDSAEFDVPDGSKATWFKPIKNGKKAAEAPAVDAPGADQTSAGEGLV